MTAPGLRRLVAVLTLVPTVSFATSIPQTRTLESLGQGASRDEAVAEALSLAVVRVRGSSLPRDSLRSMFLDAMRDERKIRVTILNDYRVQATRLSTAVAFVQDYQVQEARRDRKDGHWTARVTADVVDPEKRLAAREQTVRLSLLPFSFMQEEEGEAGGLQSQQLVAQTLQKIANLRSRVEDLVNQQARMDAVPLTETVVGRLEAALENPGSANWDELEQASGATHFVTVQAEEFRMDAVEMRRGVKSGRLDGKFVFHYRIIGNDGGTPVLLKSGTFSADTHHPRLKQLALAPSAGRPLDEREINGRVQKSLDIVARMFGNILLDELVPPDVIAREGDNLLLRSGALALRPGEQVLVLGAPTQQPDAATGLLQRHEGVRIAILEVLAVKDDRIDARILKGNAMGVQPGSFVRRMAQEGVASSRQ